MRFLIHWDNQTEADLISLYLNLDGNEVVFADDSQQLLQSVENGEKWDAVLLTTSSPDAGQAFALFQRVRRAMPGCPIVGACQTDGIVGVAQFLTNGMRTYVIRDKAGDFLFLLRATLESAVEAALAELERAVAEKLREEVESVRKLQESIIPSNLEKPKGYDVCAKYESSQIRVVGGQPVTLAGGDYYDVFRLDDNSIVLLVGDASGHGMRACMSIMTMHTLINMIRNNAYLNTASFVADVNRWLCEQRIVQDAGGFITLLYAILRTDTHELQWSSAGHPVPILHDLESNQVKPIGTLDDGGLPLGIMPDAQYEVCTTQIPPNSRLLIYTDGLEEAFPDGNVEHNQFGIEGVFETMKASRKMPLAEAMQSLFDASNAFTDGNGRHDDTSVVLLERQSQ